METYGIEIVSSAQNVIMLHLKSVILKSMLYRYKTKKIVCIVRNVIMLHLKKIILNNMWNQYTKKKDNYTNYNYIFDKSICSILYANESENILPQVKKKLGL